MTFLLILPSGTGTAGKRSNAARGRANAICQFRPRPAVLILGHTRGQTSGSASRRGLRPPCGGGASTNRQAGDLPHNGKMRTAGPASCGSSPSTKNFELPICGIWNVYP